MITVSQALQCARHKYPDMKFTGLGYSYDGDYYIELGPLDYDIQTDGPLLDAMFKVDGSTGRVSAYVPTIDGFHDLKRIRPIKKR